MIAFSCSETLPLRNSDRRGNEREREDHGTREGEEHRPRHRVEHLSFDPREGQDRQVDDHDDEHAEDARPHDLACRTEHDLESLGPRQKSPSLVLCLGELADAVLDDDDCAIHDDAEVERAEAHQIPADLGTDHSGDREEHRQRDHCRGEDRCTDVSEQQEENGHHQHGSFEQILLNGGDRGIDEIRPVVDGMRDDPLG